MRAWLWSLFLLVVPLAHAQDAPLTSRQIIAAVTYLEQHPASPEAPELRARLMRWLAQTRQVAVPICRKLEPLYSPPSTFGTLLLEQANLGDAAYQLEHPHGDPRASQAAGLQSLLRTYVAVLQQVPRAHSFFGETLGQAVIDHGQDALFAYTCDPTQP